MDYSKLCNALLDMNKKIRYVGVYNSFSGDVYEKMQNGITRHFDKDQTKKSMTQAIMRWKTRKQFASEIGEPQFAMTRYEKVNRITMACGKDGLLMLSTEVDLHLCDVIEDVIKMVKQHVVESEDSDGSRNIRT
ncbi:MAG: hypothetical protein O3C04_01340 [Crenarchaeota archaeon]|nr:hypothetical protein [Thermoproteota archaeon]MDA1124274.1 hypothetical protein [Thermoproteota archaeon]